MDATDLFPHPPLLLILANFCPVELAENENLGFKNNYSLQNGLKCGTFFATSLVFRNVCIVSFLTKIASAATRFRKMAF